ncbi:MAG: ABC transporter ATP-binding protein [Clostridiaceae bacterium]|jgi:ATP-binding cassette subfamily B multidrug efflux pump|nr:ABC transporter ATP-binding protein [Clostridiaceae bacterium]
MSENKSNLNPKPVRRGPGGGPMGRMVPGEKPKDFKKTFDTLLRYLKPYHLSILLTLIFAGCSATFSIIGPKVIGNAVTELYKGLVSKVSGVEGAGIDFKTIGNTCIFLLGLYLVSALFGFIQGYIMSGIAQKVSYNLRKAILKKINKIPLKYFDKNTHGEVLSRVTNDVDTVSHTLNQSLPQIVSSVTLIIGILFMMFSINWVMTLASLLILPFSTIFIAFVVKKSQKHFKAQQEYLGHLNGHVEEMYGGHIIMKAFNGEERSIRKFEELNDTLYSSAWKSQFLSGMMHPIMSFVGNLGYVMIAILGGYLSMNNVIQVGDILSFIQYVRQLTQPLAQGAQIANILQSTIAAAERVFEFLDEPEEAPDPENSVILTEPRGEVSFKNVSFGYDPEKIIIKDLTADIKPGQRIAIVGPTGAGKTTLVKLLMRFYDINSGLITIDGHDIKSFKREDLRSLFGMVLQDTWLFSGSIMENIRYGNQGASDEEAEAAAKAAHAHHFIRTVPDSYNMILNEEASNVSQGQKQLLTIARAILSDPKILILDEATSSVDTRTEILIQKAMDNLMKGRTSFIIAHRLSTIRDADLILVMKDGDIVEQGRHEELLQKDGFYATLYYSQFETTNAG